MTAGFALVTLCVVLEAARELCFKWGAPVASAAAGAGEWGRALRPSPMWLGILCWAVEMLAWVAALQRLPLTIAFPLMAASFAVVPLAGHLILGEPITRTHGAGIALVALGVACVGLAGGTP